MHDRCGSNRVVGSHRHMMTARAKATGAITSPRLIHRLYASTVLGSVNRWIATHRHTANPKPSRARSPGVSCTDQKVSLWGKLTRIAIAMARRRTALSNRPLLPGCRSGYPVFALHAEKGHGVQTRSMATASFPPALYARPRSIVFE